MCPLKGDWGGGYTKSCCLKKKKITNSSQTLHLTNTYIIEVDLSVMRKGYRLTPQIIVLGALLLTFSCFVLNSQWSHTLLLQHQNREVEQGLSAPDISTRSPELLKVLGAPVQILKCHFS